MSLSDAELDRYARQLVMKELGGAGQLRLKASRIALVGLGGLGAPAALYLAAAGIGSLTLIDDDHVSLDNLQRQILYTVADIGQPKAKAAAQRLAALNPHVALHPQPVRLGADTATALLRGHDLVLDGSDSFSTRLAVNAAAVALGLPLVSGALGSLDGQCALFAGHLPGQPCYQCFTGPARDQPGRSCADQGVLGPLAGLVGSLMALEALRALAGIGTPAAGQLWLLDALSGRQRRVTVQKDPACPVCSLPPAAIAG